MLNHMVIQLGTAGRAVAWTTIAAGTLLASASAGRAQQLTLLEALERADAYAYANRIASAQAVSRAGDGMRALEGMLPTVRVEAGYARTTDPIGAFGTTLRQRSITQADFDPARLNYPSAAGNYGAGLIVEQPLLNVDAHVARRAAVEAVRAERAAGEWTRLSTRVAVVRAWYGAVLAAEQATTLAAARDAALAHVLQAESMARQGLVTRSDALQARVHAGDIAVRLAEARGQAGLVRQQLATLLGTPSDTMFALPAHLPSVAAIESLADMEWTGGAEQRADVQAASSGAAAAHLDALRARSSWLPRLNAVARYDWNSRDAPFEGDENWSVGLMASWSFSAGTELAAVRGTGGRHAAARAQAEAATEQARLAQRTDANTWEVALERMRIAGQSVEHSVEAHRIVARQYEGGLATVAELLGVAATETESRLRLTHARYEVLAVGAARLHGMGRDPAELVRRLNDNGSQ
jgi:outer membrane protein